MTHPRRVIREAVAAAIAAGNTAAAARVWAAREPPVNVEKVMIEQGPAVLIYTRRDRVAKDGHSAQGYGWRRRECDLHIEILAAGALVVDTKLDDLAEQVEGILDALQITGQPATELRYVETEIESTDEFEQPVGMALLTYEACYWQQWRADPDDEEEWFPTQVSANGEVVATCDDCEDCPDGAPQ